MLLSRFSSLLVPLVGLCALSCYAAERPGDSNTQQPTVSAQQQATLVDSARAERHSSVEWLTVAPHLPDPDTATPAQLELAGDVLRARRLPEDAVEYFGYALKRGGDEVELVNRIGVTELEMNQSGLARACFKRALAVRKKYAEGWNNLGATENMAGDLRAAIADYQRAVKYGRKNAIFHANLGTAYFGNRDFESARHEFDTAIKLDPAVFQRGGFGGSQVHVLTGDDRGRFAFEMARLAAASRADEVMLHWLAVATEGGFDVRGGIGDTKEFAPYRKDPRIALLVQNQKAMQTKQVAKTETVPVLPAAVAPK